MKQIKAKAKLQIQAGKATPAPPVGPSLGQHGINLGAFCTQFNNATKSMGDDLIPVEIIIYQDRSFDLKFKTPPVSFLLRKAAGIDKGAKEAGKATVGTIKKVQVEEIAKKKIADLNTEDIKQAMKVVEGTARSMGIKVE